MEEAGAGIQPWSCGSLVSERDSGERRWREISGVEIRKITQVDVWTMNRGNIVILRFVME
jgi:hypothetical protein